jgi:diguanylate cyclase (GGDEF)-like protein
MERNRAEMAMRQQALQDPLTGLPNRLLLADHVTVANGIAGNLPAMSGADRTVFVLDIDRFKEINDTLGHAIGDLVLLEVARRLRLLGDPVEVVARLGGDEFALVAHLARDDDRLASRIDEDRLASRILSVLGEALDVGGVNLRLRGSIGVASADVDRDGNPLEVPALLRRAEAAMYQAKTEHQGVRRYSDDLERSSLSRLALASELAEAIDEGQLRLDYQPKVRCANGAISGVEALVRWQHPTRGLLLPDVFVPLAEQTGIVRELTSWVLQRALAECASWHRAGHSIPVAVNLSAGTVHDPALLDAVMSATARAGLSPAAIELEITESAVMRDPAGALRSLESLTSRGVRFALDDFGTGYSSLGYLQRLPVASVKIDKSFVKPLSRGTDSVASAIVRAVVELGHSLNLDVIAEGVDSAMAQSAVTGLGCDDMQGFFIAMPMEPQALQPWLSEHGHRPGAARPAPRRVAGTGGGAGGESGPLTG